MFNFIINLDFKGIKYASFEQSSGISSKDNKILQQDESTFYLSPEKFVWGRVEAYKGLSQMNILKNSKTKIIIIPLKT